MLKFHPSTITSSNAASTRIISFEHDFLISIHGKLKDVLPLFEKGCSVSEIQSTLGCDPETVSEIIQLLLSMKIIVDLENTRIIPASNLGVFTFGDFGSITIEEVPLVETPIYAQIKATKEKET